MKVRNDFVSNSSSCSFVIAVNKEYDVSDLAKDIAKACSNPKSEYHHKDLVKHNNRILDFCFHTYELAFLGSWKLRTEEKVFTKEEYVSQYVIDDLPEHEKILCVESGENSWKDHLEQIEKVKKPNADKYLKKLYSRDFVDADGKLHMFNDVYASNCVLDTGKMKYELSRYGYDTDDTEDTVSMRRESLKKIAEEHVRSENLQLISLPSIQCYAITMNTVKNTRDLLNAGYDLELEKYENLKKIEKRLTEGQKLFALNIGHDGDGWNNYNIYCEDGANGLDDVAAEILDSEPM